MPLAAPNTAPRAALDGMPTIPPPAASVADTPTTPSPALQAITAAREIDLPAGLAREVDE
jgi:hypothetical protein